MNTNTVIVLPVNSDPRPYSFDMTFDTKDGVRVEVTVRTREQSVADNILVDVQDKLGWQAVDADKPMPIFAIPLMVALGFGVFGFVYIVGLVVLDIAGWLPHIRVDGYLLTDTFDIVAFLMKHYTRFAIIGTLVLSPICIACSLISRRGLAK